MQTQTEGKETHLGRELLSNGVQLLPRPFSKFKVYAFMTSTHPMQGDEGREGEEKHMIEISALMEKFCRHAPLGFKDVTRVADKVKDLPVPKGLPLISLWNSVLCFVQVI